MWFRTPEKVCSSSYAARVCAAAAPGALASRVAVASVPRTALLQRREMLLGDRDLAIIPARSKRGELRKGGPRVVLLPHLLKHDAEVEGRTRISGVNARRLAQCLDGFLRLAGHRQRLPQVEEQRFVVMIGVHGVLSRLDRLGKHLGRLVHVGESL